MANASKTFTAIYFDYALADAKAFLSTDEVYQLVSLHVAMNETDKDGFVSWAATVEYRTEAQSNEMIAEARAAYAAPVVVAEVAAPLTADAANLEAAASLVISLRTYSKYNQVEAAATLDLTGQGVKRYTVRGAGVTNANGRVVWLATDKALERLKAKYSSLTKPAREYWD